MIIYECISNKDLIECLSKDSNPVTLSSIQQFLKYLEEKYGKDEKLLDRSLIKLEDAEDVYYFSTTPKKHSASENEAFSNIDMLVKILARHNPFEYETYCRHRREHDGFSYNQVDCVMINKKILEKEKI